jgi:hypothetical protein
VGSCWRGRGVQRHRPSHELSLGRIGVALPEHVETLKIAGLSTENRNGLDLCGNTVDQVVERSFVCAHSNVTRAGHSLAELQHQALFAVFCSCGSRRPVASCQSPFPKCLRVLFKFPRLKVSYTLHSSSSFLDLTRGHQRAAQLVKYREIA